MSKAKSVLGKDLMLFIDGKAIALATSCKLGLSAETIDTQSKDSGIWTEKDIKKLSFLLRPTGTGVYRFALAFLCY